VKMIINGSNHAVHTYTHTHTHVLLLYSPEKNHRKHQASNTAKIRASRMHVSHSQSVKKFSIFYGTRRFVTVFTRACRWILTSASQIQSTPFRCILILASHLCLGLPSGMLHFSPKMYAFLTGPMHGTYQWRGVRYSFL
jgi:hypothetical protein